MLANASRSLVVADVRAERVSAGKPPTNSLGIGAYAGIPLHRADGRVYGTLCALHPRARQVEPEELSLLALAGRIIMQAVETEEQRVLSTQQLAYQAWHDPLTGLGNRLLLQNRLEELIHAGAPHAGSFALLLMDLDRFKEINDAFGHPFGDQILRELGQRMGDRVRATDTIARVGGDEFAALLPETDESGAAQVARLLRAIVQEPFDVEGQHLDIDASIGIALFPEHGADGMTLLRHADTAMYAAKHGRSGYAIFDPAQDRQSRRRLVLRRALREAITGRRLQLQYQPKVTCATGQVVGVEALLRWQHRTHGAIPPEEAVALAEQTGLIKPLTVWVLHEALAQCRRWQQEGLELHVAVNLSARSLHDRDVVELVSAALGSSQLAPARLGLEITESQIMLDPALAMEILTDLRRLGVEISIDDFGTGYSSLGYLDQLGAGEMKIDKVFVMDMMMHEGHYRIVRGAVHLAHDLGLRVVAEGVEDRRTLDALEALGCDLVQGYYLGPPLAAGDLPGWIRVRHALTGAR